MYADALKKFPPAGHAIRFQKGLALYKKTDVFRGIMWYAYEGENDLIAVKAEDVKAIMEMNRNQQYPEKLEDYQVELMSTSALASEANSEEVEREIERLSEGGNGVVGQEDNRGKEGNERRPQGGDRKGRGPRNDQRGDRGERRDRDNRAREERHNTNKIRQQSQQNKQEGRPRREGDNNAPRRSGNNNNRERR